jgi:hypothetical protein
MATRTHTHPKNRLSDPVTVGNKKVEKKEDFWTIRRWFETAIFRYEAPIHGGEQDRMVV